MNPWPDDPLSAPQPPADEPCDDDNLPIEAPAAQPGEAPGAEPATAEAAPAGPIDFKDRWLRAEAELQNFRRRAQRDLEESRRSAEEGVMLEMIAALDDLDRALQAAREAQAPDPLVQGVELVAGRLREYLSRQGVVALDPAGEPFDPSFHEALLEVDAPAGVAPGHVVQVALKGYRRGPRALRAARVVVARRASGSDA